MPVGLFSKYVSGFTSDHTYQSATISTETADHKNLSLTGLTWNLLNKCHSTVVGGFSNNPFDLDETDDAYVKRKQKQLKFLWRKIGTDSVDFVFLQEVDGFKEPMSPTAKAFLKALERKGWKVILSEASDNLKQPMITLYNGNKLTFQGKKAVYKTVDGKNAGLEAAFIDKQTGAPVCLTNMHLDFKSDHSADILAYQQEKVDSGVFTIIGGDTNPHTNVVYHNLIGDENALTSITPDKQAMRYDGFMASPASPDSRVTIVEGECAYFKWVPTNAFIKMYKERRGKEVREGRYVVTKVDPAKAHLTHTQHISLPGMPWIRKAFEYLLKLGKSIKPGQA